MSLVDVNVLLYAVNASDARHDVSHRWLDRTINSNETVMVPWLVAVGFLRLSTHPQIFREPLAGHAAVEILAAWFSNGNVVAPEPGPGHLRRVAELLAATGTGGNLVNDAHLAAIAVEHDAAIVTYDNDFGRFPGIRWQPPA